MIGIGFQLVQGGSALGLRNCRYRKARRGCACSPIRHWHLPVIGWRYPVAERTSVVNLPMARRLVRVTIRAPFVNNARLLSGGHRGEDVSVASGLRDDILPDVIVARHSDVDSVPGGEIAV